MKNNVVPIVLITDDNYIVPTKVMLTSLKQNMAESTIYSIFILSDNINNTSIELLESIQCERLSINIMRIKNSLGQIDSKNKAITNSAYLKFQIPNIFPDFEKILYLDVDIIVNKDLTEIFNTDLNDTYAGAVLDYCITVNENRAKLFSLDYYFNSGVLLLNLKKIREDNLSEKMIQWVEENAHKYHFKDQDSFNVNFKNNITVLPLKFNFITQLMFYPQKPYLEFYKISKKDCDLSKIYIIHYACKKPWKFRKILFGRIWLDYYKKAFAGSPNLELKSCILYKIFVFFRCRLKILRVLDQRLRASKRGK